MQKIGLVFGLGVVLMASVGFGLFNLSSRANTQAEAPAVRFVQETTDDFEIYTITMPPSANYQLRPVVAHQAEKISSLVKLSKAPLAAINAGFFDPQNTLTTSYVQILGKTVADPTQNPRLMKNPALKPYLPAMLNRSELRVLRCGPQTMYQVTRHLAPLKVGCRVESSLQAGPNLLESNAAQTEAFIATDAQGKRTRDPLGVDRPNARSAIGIDAQGNVLLMMVGMTPTAKGPSGVTLAQLKNLLIERGAVQALALDGGSSSSLWFNGQTVYGKLDAKHRPIERPVKSAWVIESVEESTP